MAGLTAKFFNGPLAVVTYMGCAGPAAPFTEGAVAFNPLRLFVKLSLRCCVLHSFLFSITALSLPPLVVAG